MKNRNICWGFVTFVSDRTQTSVNSFLSHDSDPLRDPADQLETEGLTGWKLRTLSTNRDIWVYNWLGLFLYTPNLSRLHLRLGSSSWVSQTRKSYLVTSK